MCLLRIVLPLVLLVSTPQVLKNKIFSIYLNLSRGLLINPLMVDSGKINLKRGRNGADNLPLAAKFVVIKGPREAD